MASSELHSTDRELAESIPQITQYVSADSGIVTRKPHLPFYTGAAELPFPNSEDFQALETDLSKYRNYSRVFVYFGAIERKWRSQFPVLDRTVVTRVAPILKGHIPDGGR